MKPEENLTPAQQVSLDELIEAFPYSSTFVLKGETGTGKTTMMRALRSLRGGMCVGMRELAGNLKNYQPAAIEEAFLEVIEEGLKKTDLLLVDDLHLVWRVTDRYEYGRCNLLDALLSATIERAEQSGKKIVFAGARDEVFASLGARAFSRDIDPFEAVDYAHFAGVHAPQQLVSQIDFGQIHRFASKLNGYQLSAMARRMGSLPECTTESLTDYLRRHNMVSNVEIEEVEKVDWRDLKGMDDLIEALEAKVALPFENVHLASELRLQPKRGVLLAGPPGTGKTTIGKALAHRLKGKFFLIDGTMVAGSDRFYEAVNRVFDAAKRNAPSVIFIDDADVIFDQSGERGLYRYLLTMLDGLEGTSTGRVCVMMTAMDVGSLPPALLRSGRVELWLETQLPDEDARKTILRERLNGLPAPFADMDVADLAAASRGLTGADLKAVIEDGKLLYAHDRERGRDLQHAETYFLRAVETVRSNRRSYFRSKPPQLRETVAIGFQAN